ncbi:MAG: DUF4058 family protein [Planctomycetales bacterium]
MPPSSPFPGLDPWLEAQWADVHTRFMVYASDQIDEQLPPDLQVRVEERLGIDADGEWRSALPDVKVVERGAVPPGAWTAKGATATIAEPVYVPLEDEPPIERTIEIIDPRAGRVVTVIELLSPGNKSSEERRSAYRQRNRELIAGGVNLVEIDLIRSGSHVLAIPEEKIPIDMAGGPLVCVRRATRRGADLFSAPLREPLPNIPIPLRATDGDVVLRLQPIFDDIYRKGRYDSIDYSHLPSPRLSLDDQQWADDLVRKKVGMEPLPGG